LDLLEVQSQADDLVTNAGPGREGPVVSNLILAARGNQGGKPAQEGNWLQLQHELGLSCVVRLAEPIGDLARVGARESLVGEGGTIAVAKESLETGAVEERRRLSGSPDTLR
jgi:hypothetical protein